MVKRDFRGGRRQGFDPWGIPGWSRPSGKGNGNPLQYFCVGNPTDRGAWRATVHGVAKSWTRLNNWTTTTVKERTRCRCSLLGVIINLETFQNLQQFACSIFQAGACHIQLMLHSRLLMSHLLIPQEQRRNNRKNNLGFLLAKLKQSQGRCPVQLALEIIPLEGLPLPGSKAESPKNLCISSATHQTVNSSSTSKRHS